MRGLIAFLLLWSLQVHGAIDPLTDAGDRKLIGSAVLQQALASTEPNERVRAAFVLGRMQDTRGIDPLLKLLKDPGAEVREAAAFNLGQYGWRALFGREAEMQAALQPLTLDAELKVRVAAVEALGKVGLLGTPDLAVPFFNDKSALIREKAAMALSRYRMVLKLRAPEAEPAPLPETAMTALLNLRRDRDVNVRRAVAYYFVRNADARGESALAALTRDQDKWVKFYAFTGLAKMKAKSSKTAILRGLSDGRYFIRLAALNAFIAAEYDLYSQRKLAKDISWHVRAAYARGLKADVVAQNLLLNKMLASDKSPSVKTEALKALAKDPAFAPQVLTYLKSSEWQLREAAVQSHAAFPPEKKEELLTQSYADPDKNVRMAALGELAKIPTVSAFQILKTALTSDELTIRGTAVGALSERQEPEIAELAWSTYKNSGDSKWVEIRQEIVGLMAKQSTSQSLKNLRQAAKDPDPSVSALAIEALVKRGEKDLPAPVLGGSLTFTPYRDLTFAANPKIEFETNKGRFLVETYPKEAPVHVANLVGQTKAGLYNGLSWHRVVSNFVVQGGDPDGSGWGDAGYSMRIEVNRVPFERGTLGMPRSSGFDTGGVQLFFDLVPTPHLDGLYTVFGKVVRGEEVLDRLERGDKILKARVLE